MRDIEQRLAQAGAVWRSEQPPAPAPQAHPERPRRWLPAAAAVAVVALVVTTTSLVGRAPEQRPAQTSSPSGTWASMSAAPLSPRLRPTMVGRGEEVIVLGGDPYSRPCPPNAACVRDLREAPRDGAVYDVVHDRWDRLPDAPRPLDISSSAVVGDVLYLWLPDGVLALDLVTHRWASLPDPPTVSQYLRLVAAGGQLVAYYNEVGRADARDLMWVPGVDAPERGRWEVLPTQPFGASFDRSIVWTGHTLLLVAAAPAGETGPPFVRAAVLAGQEWRTMPPQDVVIGGSTDWSWTGDRAVSASTYEADGGQTNGFGRAYPSGGYLDPRRGRWAELPRIPVGHQRRVGLPHAAGGRYVANGEGLVLDTERERWLALPPQPDQADQDAGAAWASGRLVVWGGAAGVRPAPQPDTARSLGSGAVWTPPRD